MSDTVIYDVNKITNYQSNSNYDYLAQLDIPDYSWFDLISRWFNSFLNSIFSSKIGENVTTPLLIVIFILLLASVVYFLYKKRPELFIRSKKTASIPYIIEEENIHHINFDQEIESALQNHDFRLAIRLLYLQTLRFLTDNKLIDWQIHKTPTEYIYEITNREMKQSFRVFTNYFLHVRYGNYQATCELYEIMHDLQASIKQWMKGGAV